FREDGNLVLGATTKGRWSYACSKAIDEFLALAYWREKGLPTVVVRLFNTVGPRQTGQYGMVVPTFVRQALAGEPITVYGDGTQLAADVGHRPPRDPEAVPDELVAYQPAAMSAGSPAPAAAPQGGRCARARPLGPPTRGPAVRTSAILSLCSFVGVLAFTRA